MGIPPVGLFINLAKSRQHHAPAKVLFRIMGIVQEYDKGC